MSKTMCYAFAIAFAILSIFNLVYGYLVQFIVLGGISIISMIASLLTKEK